MFWTGLIVGIFIGANMGVIILGLLVASRDTENRPVHRCRRKEESHGNAN